MKKILIILAVILLVFVGVAVKYLLGIPAQFLRSLISCSIEPIMQA